MDKLRTGDIVLFSGRCKVGRLIRFLTWSKWSHVGLIINDDPKHDFPLLYESTHNNTIKGLDIGDHTSGVQIVPFKERLAQYNGDVAVRRVINPDYSKRQRLRDYRAKMIGNPFEENILEVFAAAPIFKWLRKGEDLSSVFCSEHHAQALIELGWLPDDIPSNHYPPKFFAESNSFLNGVSYSDIEYFKIK